MSTIIPLPDIKNKKKKAKRKVKKEEITDKAVPLPLVENKFKEIEDKAAAEKNEDVPPYTHGV